MAMKKNKEGVLILEETQADRDYAEKQRKANIGQGMIGRNTFSNIFVREPDKQMTKETQGNANKKAIEDAMKKRKKISILDALGGKYE